MSGFRPVGRDEYAGLNILTGPHTWTGVLFNEAMQVFFNITIPWGGHVVQDALYVYPHEPGAFIQIRFPTGIPMWLLDPPENINGGKLCRVRTGNLRIYMPVTATTGDLLSIYVYAGTKGAKRKHGNLFPSSMLNYPRDPGQWVSTPAFHRELLQTRNAYGYQAMVDAFLSQLAYAPLGRESWNFAAPGNDLWSRDNIYTPINDKGDFHICAR